MNYEMHILTDWNVPYELSDYTCAGEGEPSDSCPR